MCLISSILKDLVQIVERNYNQHFNVKDVMLSYLDLTVIMIWLVLNVEKKLTIDYFVTDLFILFILFIP